MFAHRKLIDLASIESANGFHKGWIEATVRIVMNIQNDSQRKERYEKQECPFCFYRESRIGCAACTSVQCGLCDETIRSGSSYIDVLCKNCAKEHGLCKHCGADIDLKNRRNRSVPKPTPAKEDL